MGRQDQDEHVLGWIKKGEFYSERNYLNSHTLTVKDPELWYRHGNCFVHLYARGQSRRGPSFKVPISTLLAAQCHALVERFITRDMHAVPDMLDVYDMMHSAVPTSTQMPQLPSLATLDYWSRAHLIGRVDLYIPPPDNADRDETFLYYLAIRNLFAWVFRRPVVGAHLGSALAGLYSAMREFRHPQADNVQDLLCFLEDEGYSAMAGHPAYALALLHLAETMPFRALYIDAFSHCVGMYNDLHLGSEYPYMSAESRKQVRRARLDMDMRLGSAGTMLSNFLEDALSESHLGLPEPARAHLDRFRTYVQGFYTSRLGYYPPRSLDKRSTIFEPHVYRTLADDFKALYDFLVDESFMADGTTTTPTLAQGGFCVLQSVNAFDERHGFTSMQHPLPLLPEVALQTPNTGSSGSTPSSTTKTSGFSRRMSIFGGKTMMGKMDKLLLSRSEKLKPDARLLANAALLKASNKVRPDLWRNEFVCAYRQFEEDSVFKPYKADRMEKISMIDARKVRWILVYAVHQTLQNCFLPPPAEVNGAGAVVYHMSISPKYLPTWDDGQETAVHGHGHASTAKDSYSVSPVSPTSPTAWSTDLLMPADDNAWNNDPAQPVRCMSMTALPDAPTMRSLAEIADGGSGIERGRALSPVFDIRPDIDYLGLANRGDSSPLDGEVVMLPRSRSLTRSLSQKATFRRSLSLFRGNNGVVTTSTASPTSGPTKLQKGKQPETTEPVPALPSMSSKRNSFLQRSLSSKSIAEKQRAVSRERKSSPYHEIVVHGYGNGTNPVQLAVSTDVAGPSLVSTEKQTDSSSPDPSDDSVATPSTSRSLSTSSTNSNTSALTAETALTTYTDATHRSSIGCAISTNATTTSASTTGTTTTLPDEVAAFFDTPIGALHTLSRSSSVYSNASSKGVILDMAPAIPPRGRGRAVLINQPTPSLSRSSSVYSTASISMSMRDDASTTYVDMSAPPPLPAALSVTSSVTTTTAPPVPVRNSARHRRFSVYGGGDEYASVSVLPLVTKQSSQKQGQKQYHGRRGSTTPHRSRTMPNVVSSTLNTPSQPYQRLDMVQEALMAVRETMEQQSLSSMTPKPLSVPVTRTSSFVGMASALRSVHEEEEFSSFKVQPLLVRSQSQSRAQSMLRSSGRQHRHSSYIGPRDDDDDDVNTTDDVQPEWEKFAMGLGGHTVV